MPPRFAVAVGSGKGGVGKSTVSANLALALAESGEEVALLDADVYGPNIPLMFNLARRRPAKHWTLARAGGVSITPVQRHGIRIFSAGFIAAEDQPLAWESNLVSLLIQQMVNNVAWDDPDFLIIDLPPGTATIQQTLVSSLALSGAVVVVTPQDVAHLDARRAVAMFRGEGVPVIGGVENMSGMGCPHCGEKIEVFHRVREDRSIWSLGVEKLGELQLDPAMSRATDSGHPVMLAAPASLQAHAFRGIASRIAERLGSPLA